MDGHTVGTVLWVCGIGGGGLLVLLTPSWHKAPLKEERSAHRLSSLSGVAVVDGNHPSGDATHILSTVELRPVSGGTGRPQRPSLAVFSEGDRETSSVWGAPSPGVAPTGEAA